MPASLDVNQANVQIRIPTDASLSLGQNVVLQNLTGHRLTTEGNGSVDFGSPTQDLVRAFRSGGGLATTADPYNGFLRDETPPQLVTDQTIFIAAPPMQSPLDPGSFVLPSVPVRLLLLARNCPSPATSSVRRVRVSSRR